MPAKFSVVIPNYNRQDMVCDAVESVLCQTYPAFEIIVVDDGSSDDSVAELTKRFGSKIIVIVQENSGVSTARNAGVEAASGDYICYLDSDDLWRKDKLELIARNVEKYPDAGLFFHDFAKHDIRATTVPYSTTNTDIFPYLFEYSSKCDGDTWFFSGHRLVELLLRGYAFYPSAFVVKALVHQQYRWDPGVLKSEDFNFVLKLSIRYAFVYIHHNAATVRVHGSNKSDDYITKNRIVLQTMEFVRDLYKHGMPKATFNQYIYPKYFRTGISYIKKKHLILGVSYVLTGLSSVSTYGKLATVFKRKLLSNRP